MTRDVVLDVIIAKAAAKHYMAACDIAQEALEKAAEGTRAVIVRGLIRQYASAVSKGDVTAAGTASLALQRIPFTKAMEIFNYASGQRQVEVYRDRSGRFSSYLAGSTSSMLPASRQGGRKPNDVVVSEAVATPRPGATDSMLKPLEQGLNNFGQNPVQGQLSFETASQLAGRVRAVNRFQDELHGLFGDSEDIVVVLEGQTAPGQTPVQATLGTSQPISPEAYDILQSTTANGGAPTMTYGLKPSADKEAREKFLMLNSLLDSGIPPHIAADLVSNPQRIGEAKDVQEALTAYAGAKPDTAKKRIDRHLQAAERIGEYFMNTGSPQLATAGAALRGAARIGNAIDPETIELAQRMNYRYRGQKDRLPREYSDALRMRPTSEQDVTYQTMIGSFYDQSMTPQVWRERRRALEMKAQEERDLSMRRDGTGASMSDPLMAVVSHASRTVPWKASPRNYIDRISRDLAITSLIREIPSDRRAVELGESAGYGVPSSGIIIRADGQAKEMYRGIADDHYLPFSAKALPELRDGQYVRTRVLGGLTPEDITTAVVSGARKVAVVSGSGVFTLELRPNTSLIGRLASPEVAAMGERYERILDQVAASGIYMQDIPPQEKAALRQQAMTSANSSDKKVWGPRYDVLLDRARRTAMQLSKDEIQSIKDTVEAEVPRQKSPQDRARLVAELQEERLADAEAEKVRAIQLNAEGYEVALKTLAMQYPAIINRVGYESLPDFTQSREMQPDIFAPAEIMVRSRKGAKDTGLAAPGETSSYARNKEWRTGPNAKRSESRAGAAGAAPAGATAPAAGAGTAAAGTAPQGPGSTLISVQSKMRDILTRHYDAASQNALQMQQQQKIVPGTLASNVKTTFTTKADFDGALVAGGTLGPDVDFKADAAPASIFQSANMMKHAAESSSGRAVAMALAFADNPGKWKGLEDDDTGQALSGQKLQEAKVALDLAVSSALLTSATSQTAPVDVGNSAAFVVQPDLFTAIDPGFAAADSEQVRDRVAAVAFDDSTPEGESRKRGLDAIAAFASNTSNASYLNRISHNAYQSNIGGDPMSSLSLLGLLALQSKMTDSLNRLDRDKNKEDAKMVLAVSGEQGFDSDAEFDTAKKATILAVQAAIGSQYLLRTLGDGGDVGPKALSVRFAKTDGDRQPPHQEQLDLLLRLVEENPQQPLPQHGRLEVAKQHRTSRPRLSRAARARRR